MTRTRSPGLQDAEVSMTTTKGSRDSRLTFPYFKQYLPFGFFFSFYFKKASISQRSRATRSPAIILLRLTPSAVRSNYCLPATFLQKS